MKKHLVILLVVCLQSTNSFGQIKFFKVFTNNGYDYGQGITQLADSSYMVTGSSSSFEAGPSQVFLLKLDSLGQYLWSRNYGGTEGDWGRRVLNWNDSIFYVAGYSISPLTGMYHNYLLKCDKDGNQLVEKQYVQNGWDKVNDAIWTADSTIYMVGETTATPTNFSNFYIVKTDHNGDTLWTRNFGTSGEDKINSIKQFNDTTFYAVGEIYNSDSLKAKGVIIKFYKNGNIAWTKEFGGYGNYALYDFFIRGGNLYSIGKRVHPTDGDMDEYRLTTTMEGVFIEEFADHLLGDIFYEQVAQYGSDGKVYIGRYRQDEFSTGGSVDAAITRYYDNLVWNNLNIDVSFLQEDRNCHIVKTSDGGAIATGFITLDGFGGSSVYVLKIGPNDDFPAVNLSSVENLVTIQELMSANDDTFFLYPNPSINGFKIKTSLDNPRVEIVNLFGQTIWSEKVGNGIEISTQDWAKGLYFVNYIASDNSLKTIKLIVQ